MSTLNELNAVIGGRLWLGDTSGDAANAPLGAVQSDSRSVEPGDLFWTLQGPNHRGEDFVGEAFRRGAAGATD